MAVTRLFVSGKLFNEIESHYFDHCLKGRVSGLNRRLCSLGIPDIPPRKRCPARGRSGIPRLHNTINQTNRPYFSSSVSQYWQI